MSLAWLQPWALGLVALPLVLWFLAWRGHRSPERKTLWKMSTPLAALKRHSQNTKKIYAVLCILSGIGLAALALSVARPVRWEAATQNSKEGIDIVITLDASESMVADDFKPMRMIVAKKVILDFIEKRPDDRIGLVVFGGEAVTKCPLTEDHEFLRDQVEAVQMRELKQGTAIGMGIANAVLRLKESKARSKVIVLITDGDSNVGDVNPITAAQLARQQGIKVYSIGIGKDDRVLVPIYSYDSEGNRRGLVAQVPSYLNPALLREVSQITGGKAYMARNTGMLFLILAEIDRLEKGKIRMAPRLKKLELYFLPGAAGLILLFLVWLLMDTRYRRARIRNVVSV